MRIRHPPPSHSTTIGGALILAVVLLAGCDRTSDPAASDTLSASTVADGVWNDCTRPGSISSERAAELALAALRTFGTSIQGRIDRQHGAPVDFESLTVIHPVSCAASPYVETSADVEPGVRKGLGPYYVVNLSFGGVPAVMVAVSALNSDLWIDQDQLRFPTRFGNDFLVRGIPRAQPSLLLDAPTVSELVASRGGHLIRPPYMQRRGLPYHPLDFVWRLDLQREATVLVDETAVQTASLALDATGSFWIEDPSGPSATRIPYPKGVAPRTREYRLQAPGYFRRVDAVQSW